VSNSPQLALGAVPEKADPEKPSGAWNVFDRTLANGLRVYVEAPANWAGNARISWGENGAMRTQEVPALFVKRLLDAEDQLFELDLVAVGEKKPKPTGRYVFCCEWPEGWKPTYWSRRLTQGTYDKTGPLRLSLGNAFKGMSEDERRVLRVVKYELVERESHGALAFYRAKKGRR
jgi:hypothetical protein